jgi:hypothetical protein
VDSFQLDAPVTISVQCRAASSAPSDTRHPVTIHEDWSLTTPHDLAAERVGVALGGYSSCVVLADVTLSDLRGPYALAARERRPALRPSDRGWSIVAPDRQKGCCPATPFPTARAAAQHVLSERHALHGLRSPHWQASEVMRELLLQRGAKRAFDRFGIDAQRWVGEVMGMTDIWAAGIHPRDVPALASPAATVGDALPTNYFVNMAYGSADPQWIAEVLPARPDPDTAAWLAGLDAPHRIGTPDEWRKWLGHAIPREEALSAVTMALPESVVAGAADALGVTSARAASVMVSFAKEGLPLKEEHLLVLGLHGVTAPLPHERTVAQLAERLNHRRKGTRLSHVHPTELSVMLNILGNQQAVARAVGRGSVLARDLPIPAFEEG